MPFVKERNAEPIPGYRLLERLGSGGFGEVWKCEAPGGLYKAIKFVYGDPDGLGHDGAQAEEERRAIERIKAIRHPFLLSMERVEVQGGELLIVTELADKNLYDLFAEQRAGGHAGIPRSELLDYLAEAAEVLDLLNVRHGLQHLDVKPHNLFLVSNHVKVADFGLVNSLGAGGRIQLGAITPLYASPEVFRGSISKHSDQYSLAVVYQELLTGKLPFQGKNTRQLLLLHTQGEPDLTPLPEADSATVARALAKDPDKRFSSCLEFVRALRKTAAKGPRAPEVIETAAVQAAVETARVLSVTPGGRAPAPRNAPPAVGALAGYRFLQCHGSTPLMDIWRVQAQGGRQRLVKLLYGAAADRDQLQDALVRFRLLLHPGLVPLEAVQSDPGRLVLVTDAFEDSLRERLQQCLSRKQPGVPRDEVLGYLCSAAEVLDYLYQQHSVQHLGLNPRSLLLDRGRLVLADFGLAQLFWLPAGQPIAQRNARYAAPELFGGVAGRTSDQFSLAVTYHELLTGGHPWNGRSARTAEDAPDLHAVPEGDREALARALSADPAARWPSCTEFVRALQGDRSEPAADRFSQRLSAAPAARPRARSSSEIPEGTLTEVICRLVSSAGAGTGGSEEAAPALSAEEGLLSHQFSAGLPLGAARLKLDALRQQWYGQLIAEDDHEYVFHVSMPVRFWRQWIGRQPGLEVRVRLARQHAQAATPIDVQVRIRAFRCTRARGDRLLEEMGTSLLESLRASLLVNAEKRVQERMLWPHALQVRPVLGDGTLGEPVSCRGKDISRSGIGFYLPRELPTAEVSIDLPATAATPAIAVPATLVRAKRCADGWYEVGALFRLAALRKSLPELCAVP
jgi:serine/threonine protein kinase